jgi:adenylate kinase
VNIFVAGVHGVGKTYLASQLPATLGLFHTSASKLIKEERALPNWGLDKRVIDVDANQLLLAEAVKRHNAAGMRLLLDGHFVLLNSEGGFSRLGPEVFTPLNLDGVVLLEDDPDVIAARLRDRDGTEGNHGRLLEFIELERSQAELVCDQIGRKLLILNAPSLEKFSEAIAAIARNASVRRCGR